MFFLFSVGVKCKLMLIFFKNLQALLGMTTSQLTSDVCLFWEGVQSMNQFTFFLRCLMCFGTPEPGGKTASPVDQDISGFASGNV